MALIASKTVALNLDTSAISAQVYVDQFDSGSRRLRFKIYHGEAPFAIPELCKVTISGTKSKWSFIHECSYSGNVVTADLKPQMTVEAGKVVCGLTIVDTDGRTIGSANFNLIVQESEVQNGGLNTSDITYIRQAMNRIQSVDALRSEVTQLDATVHSYDSAINSLEEDRDRLVQFMNFHEDAIINVKEHGAKGDYNLNTGVGTDDYAALQAIFDDASNDGKIVFFPPGEYLIKKALRVPSYTTIIGSGATLRPLGTTVADTKCGIINKSDGTTSGNLANERIYIYGMNFRPAKNSTAEMGLVAFGHARHIVIRDCRFYDVKAWHMIEINTCADVVIDSCLFSNYGGDYNQSEAVQLDYCANSTVWPWFGPWDDASGTKGICQDITISNCTFDGTASYIQDANIYRMVGDRKVTRGYRFSPTAIGNHTKYPVGGSMKDTMYASNRIRNVRIVNNCFNNMGSAVKLVQGEGIIFANNNVNQCQTGFVVKDGKVKDVLIANNQFVGRRWVAGAGDDAISDNMDEGDKVSPLPLGYSRGVSIWNGCGKTIRVVGNSIRAFHGIGLGLAVSIAQVKDNLVSDCGYEGIYCGYNESGSDYRGNKAYANHTRNTIDSSSRADVRVTSATEYQQDSTNPMVNDETGGDRGDMIFAGNTASTMVVTQVLAPTDDIYVWNNVAKASLNTSGASSSNFKIKNNFVNGTLQS